MTKEARVQMLREDINISYQNQFPHEWQADCVFQFKNLTNREIEIQMGFPDWPTFGDASVDHPWAIKDFKVWVKGKVVQPVHKKVVANDSNNKVTLPGGKNIHYGASYTWKVKFKPSEVITVKNQYQFGGIDTNGPFSDLIHKNSNPQFGMVDAKALFWDPQKKFKPQENNFNEGIPSLIHYIVTTGLSWQGPIKEAKITIDLPPQVFPHLMFFQPQGYQVKDRKVSWHFKNFVPQEEILLSYIKLVPAFGGEAEKVPSFNTVREAQNWIRIAKRNHYDAKSVRLVRQLVEAKYGKSFDDPEMNHLLKRVLAYKINPNFSKKRISKEDKKIMAVLRDFEESLK